MDFLIVLASLCFLMFVAYRGYSVILFAPIAAMGAVLLTDPGLVAPMFSGVFMKKMVVFVELYFPVFLLGAIFGKVVELSGYAKSIVAATIKYVGSQRAILCIVIVCCLLTYGGVSLFVVVFAVYPFAAEMFRQNNIPKRLIPGTIALGAFTVTMDCLPGTPQIQNIIPTTFFKTDAYAAPWLGVIGAVFIMVLGLSYLEWRRRVAIAEGEGYTRDERTLVNEPEKFEEQKLPNPWLAISPLILVGVLNFVFTRAIVAAYGASYEFTPFSAGAPAAKVVTTIASYKGIWAVEGALLVGILFVLATAWKEVAHRFGEGSKSAIAGSLLAALNTASEYGFGAVIASLAGFATAAAALKAIPDPLINEAITVTSLAGITGSASGGMSIALAAMADTFKAAATAANIPFEVLHRIASMASGGMDTLPHNGAVITLLMVTGLTHRTSYKDIFAITCIKTIAVFFVIAVYYTTGIV
jgi:H+/gluconate symporter-like permease